MLQIALWKRLVIWVLCIGGLLMALPNAFYSRVENFNDARVLNETSDEWLSFLPSSLVNLGLDLRGGAHLLAEVQVSDVYKQRMAALWPDVREILRAERNTVGTIRLQKGNLDELRIKLSDPSGVDAGINFLKTLAKPVSSVGSVGKLDLDIVGENDEIIVRLSVAERRATDNRTMQQALEIIRRRIDEVGTREPTIQRQGTDRILIQVPGIGSASELKQLIGTTAQLTFQPVIAARVNSNSLASFGQELLPALEDPDEFYLLDAGAVVTGEELVDAQPSFDQNGRPAVNFRFNPSGARKFGDYTAENIGNPFAIVLDNEVISAPTIQSHIPGGSGIITGSFSIEESTELAILLRAGALPAGLSFLEERTIGPELGADSIQAGKVACLVAFGAVLIFMAASYGLFGLFANVALIINVGLIFGLLSGIGATLTLPGIAGIVLTIGMAVDANVLIFERIREELVSAKGPARAIELGYEKAMSAILDANITTFIAAVILFVMGSGPVRGFSITLGLGILTSVFTAIFVTRLLVVMWFERRRPKTIEV
ncbi:MAG: protein translocase subunit SecD [Rhodobacteraceae bacterium]|nr:protein translocase subunit SecD [Paracoccaceae bacterium]